MKRENLKLIGARENNLKQISIDIPHDQLVVLTGISGSGKSSLAFDTVYAEGQQRYIETFSPYTRQFFDKVKKPALEAAFGVRPAVAIQQKTRVTGSRSTVGSLTNINDLLKIVWSNLGVPYCEQCQAELKRWSSASLADKILLEKGEFGTKQLLICAEFNNTNRSSNWSNEIERLLALGYSRAVIEENLQVVPLSNLKLPSSETKLLVVIDRITPAKVERIRLRDSLEQAFTLGSGTAALAELAPDEQGNKATRCSNVQRFRDYFFCQHSTERIPTPRPALFSFNSPLGACNECRGFGNVLAVNMEACVPDPRLSIEDGAIHCWSGAAQGEYRRLIKFCQSHGIATTAPWLELPEDQRNLIISNRSKEYRGLVQWFEKLAKKSYKMHVRVFLSRYRKQIECPSCNGTRLKSAALRYRIGRLSIADFWNLPTDSALQWTSDLAAQYNSKNDPINQVLRSVETRLKYLVDLGLPYLTLDRQTRTLSGGETQRVNLASALGSDLISTQFVLDEPSVGLHARDSARLIAAVRSLSEKGNSVLMVEHDTECIRAADHIIEMGPLAGESGGQVMFQGPQSKWRQPDLPQPKSLPNSSQENPTACLTISSARERNLKIDSLRLPLNRFVTITGVSGSGKSTLIEEVLINGYTAYKRGRLNELRFQIQGFEQIGELLNVDQSPLAKSPRSNIATYSGVWEVLRTKLAQTEDAKRIKASKSHFSFNVDGGRCPACKGAGFNREEMQFLSDVYVQCDLCLGKRFNAQILEVRIEGLNVDELLNSTVDRCRALFDGDEKITTPLYYLSRLGLGHLTLGHSLSELSGGEAQRLKLIPVLSEAKQQRVLFIFDEPTTGLHSNDIVKLTDLFEWLVKQGHSVVCVEHNLLLISRSDWMIELGPEGGAQGGKLLTQGNPILLASGKEHSVTINYLRGFLEPGRPGTPPQLSTNQVNRRSTPNKLTIRKAHQNNLKNIDVDIPLQKFVAITGVSGSGKSTIAKDIIYAEGQRRYLDCLSPYARQFIKELSRPAIDSIENIQPTICVYQHTFQPSHLSTVGTMSEVYNFLRLLFAKCGVQFCPDHPDQAISSLSAEEISEQLLLVKAPNVKVLAPQVISKKGYHREIFQAALAAEIFQVRVDGKFGRTADFIEGLERNKAHTIELVTASFTPSNMRQELLIDTVRDALSRGSGSLVAHFNGEDHIFSTDRTCRICKTGFFKPDPEDLSFSARRGRCKQCEGSGQLKNGKLCPSCSGQRLNPISRNLRLGKLNISELCQLPPEKILAFLAKLSFRPSQHEMVTNLMKELRGRLSTLIEFGLDYLALNRACNSLSGGELQRLRLSAAIGSALSGVMYIFDEPTAGLHPSETGAILNRISSLVSGGNSVLVIEHDLKTIRESDYVIEVGPGAGSRGGEIVFAGLPKKLQSAEATPTAIALTTPPQVTPNSTATNAKSPGWLTIQNANYNNLNDVNCKIPLQSLVVVCGVSGAGKSSLARGVLHHTFVESHNNKRGNKQQAWSSTRGELNSDQPIGRIIEIDQKPIGINSRSTPASYLGLWDEIRKIFAASLEAKVRGLSQSYFSYNTGKGRCQSCKGLGEIKLEMNFLPDARVICEECDGRRFSNQADEVKYLGMSISEVLGLSFEEAKLKFANHRRLHQALHLACELGLGYLTLGQSSATLSGGESQRLKLVAELAAKPKDHSLYLLDEPTTGLHRQDVKLLLTALRNLVHLGHTVLVIEHDPDLISESDYLIEIGPGPGEHGGKIIFAGSPRELLTQKTPWGHELREYCASFISPKSSQRREPLVSTHDVSSA